MEQVSTCPGVGNQGFLGAKRWNVVGKRWGRTDVWGSRLEASVWMWEGRGQWHSRRTEYVCSLDPGCQTLSFTKGIWDPWRNEVFQILGRGNSVWGRIILYQKPRKWSKIDGDMSKKEQPGWVPNGQIWAFWAQKRMTIMDTVNLGSPRHSKWKSQGCSRGVCGASHGRLPVQVEPGRLDIHQGNSQLSQDRHWSSESIVWVSDWWRGG